MFLRKGSPKGEGYSGGKARRFRNQLATVLPQQPNRIMCCSACGGIQYPQIAGLETEERRR